MAAGPWENFVRGSREHVYVNVYVLTDMFAHLASFFAHASYPFAVAASRRDCIGSHALRTRAAEAGIFAGLVCEKPRSHARSSEI